MKFKKEYLVGICIGLALLIFNIIQLRDTRWFIPLIVVSFTIAWIQAWIDFFLENKRQREIEARFVDFVRNLSGAIKSGMPVSRAIMHISKSDYGALTPYVEKLGHQVEWAVPVRKALMLFSNSTRNDIIKRSIATVIEAEQSGGNMEDVLASITTSLIEIKKIKEERRASIHSQTMQSYIIFIIFLGVMVVIQTLLLPYLIPQDGQGILNFNINTDPTAQLPDSEPVVQETAEVNFQSLSSFILSAGDWMSSQEGIFLMLALIQGLFAGMTIGKLAEGDITAGFKHSLALMTIALIVMTFFS